MISSRSLKAFVTALAIAVISPTVALADDEPSLEFTSPAVCTTEGDAIVRITPGVYLPKATYDRLEQEYVDAQTKVIRLEAENQALKEWEPDESPTWVVGVLALTTGVFAGHYLWR